jgi:hypothetical protein
LKYFANNLSINDNNTLFDQMIVWSCDPAAGGHKTATPLDLFEKDIKKKKTQKINNRFKC